MEVARGRYLNKISNRTPSVRADGAGKSILISEPALNTIKETCGWYALYANSKIRNKGVVHKGLLRPPLREFGEFEVRMKGKLKTICSTDS